MTTVTTNSDETMQTLLTEKQFRFFVLETENPVLVEVRADWSGASHIIAPVVHKLQREYKHRITFVRLDFDHLSVMLARYGVRLVPSLLLFKNGELLRLMTGLISPALLRCELDAVLQSPS